MPIDHRSGAAGDPFVTPSQLLGQDDDPERITAGRYRLPDLTIGWSNGDVLLTGDGPRKGGWQRVTTLVKAIGDARALDLWHQRLLVLAMVRRPDLYDLACATVATTPEDQLRVPLEDLAGKLLNAIGADEGANLGTAFHGFTEAEDLGLMHYARKVWHGKIRNYREGLEAQGLVPLPEYVERKVVVLRYGLAGTLDRILMEETTEGMPLRIGDLKGIALTTPIPTPSGWTTMEAIRPGDQVFDAYGKPCTVTAKSEPKNIGTYVVRFDDGSEVVCDTEHIWWTDRSKRGGEPQARPISEVIETLTDPNTGQRWHRVPVAGALELPEADLFLDPYLMGCWLGDGETMGSVITSMRDLLEIMRADGHPIGKITESWNGATEAVRWCVRGMRTKLRHGGMLGNKHIPDVYLRASIAQRLRLLQGLMDTDGTWNTARKTAVFYTTKKALAIQVEELLLSLGQRPHVAEVPTTGFGKDVISYHVAFTPVGINPFRLPRKADQAAASTKSTTRSRRRVIMSIEPGPDVPTACIAVDSATSTYLCGERMVPTHNSQKRFWTWLEISAQLAAYAMADAMWDRAKCCYVEMPPVAQDLAVVAWMPVNGLHYPEAATSTGDPDGVDFFNVDLERGREALELCSKVDRMRSEAKSKAQTWGLLRPAPVLTVVEAYARRIGAVSSLAEGSALWAEIVKAGVHEVPELIELASERVTQLQSELAMR